MLKKLPEYGISLLADSLNLSKKLRTQPHQNLLSLNACLGKPNGGIRTVTKTPLLYRIGCRADTTIPKWEEENLQPYDSACKGASALRAVLLRNFQSEIAHWTGFVVAGVFNDCDKLFVSIDVVKLLQETFHTNFYPLNFHGLFNSTWPPE